MSDNHNPRFKAIIVGGSIAGLILAHAFESARIDYVLLEGRDHIAPAAGATIVIMPNGARTLDQLGLYETMREIMEPMQTVTTSRSDGTHVSINEWPKIVEERFRYPAGVFQRRKFLQLLHAQLKSKHKILLNKRVTKIVHGLNSVKVQCVDGMEFVADIVVGADGIHSRVRQEMQRLQEENHPGSTTRDKECIMAEYKCIFGVSEPVSTLHPGHVHISQDIDHSALLFVAKNSMLQWFFISKMDQKYQGRAIPRFTKSQMEEQTNQYAEFQFTKGLTFKDLLKTTSTMSYLALEEARHESWTHGRIVCVGDSIHKMTPNLGQGGNQAIESATVLTNCLLELLGQHTNDRPSLSDLEPVLQKYQTLRKDRSDMFIKASAGVTRTEALATLSHTLRFLYMEPVSTKLLADIQTSWYINAPNLKHLPIPKTQEGNKIWVDKYHAPSRPKIVRAQL